MTARLTNVAKLAGEGYQGFVAVEKFLAGSGIPQSTLHLMKLRASQINGCGYCVDMHSHDAKKEGETDERLFGLATWREAPYFTDAERAALALTEAATRIADNPHGVPDDVWNEAAAHYDEQELAALVTAIAMINAWNRFGVTLRLPAGSHRR